MQAVGRRHPAVPGRGIPAARRRCDQETAIRGYPIAADPQFLAPYYDGQQSEQQAAQDIRRLLSGRPELIADLDAVERAAAGWRARYAEPLIAGVTPAPRTSSAAVPPSGKAQFDAMRTLFDTQNDNLGTARTAAIDQLDRTCAWRDAVLAGIIVAFVITAFALAILVRGPSPGRSARSPRPAGESPTAVSVSGSSRRAPGHSRHRLRRRGHAPPHRRRARQRRSGRALLDEQAEELRRSNAELEQFAYVASHPAGAAAQGRLVLPAAGEALRDQLDERGIQYIDFAVDGAKRMQIPSTTC